MWSACCLPLGGADARHSPDDARSRRHASNAISLLPQTRYSCPGSWGNIMKFAIALIAGIGLATAAAAEELPTCAVGMHLERAGGTNSPAVITEVDEAQGSYHIDYDNSTLEEWVTAQW